MKKFLYIGVIMVLTSICAIAQPTSFVLKVHFANTDVSKDTVTSTATGYVGNLSPINNARANTTVQAIVTKVSGTVGGTLTLQGSHNPTSNFKALTTIETATALATYTAADATSAYYWRLTGNPFPYYRVSYTGGSGAVAYLEGLIISH